MVRSELIQFVITESKYYECDHSGHGNLYSDCEQWCLQCDSNYISDREPGDIDCISVACKPVSVRRRNSNVHRYCFRLRTYL